MSERRRLAMVAVHVYGTGSGEGRMFACTCAEFAASSMSATEGQALANLREDIARITQDMPYAQRVGFVIKRDD